MHPVLLIMLDGISADAVARRPSRSPHLRATITALGIGPFGDWLRDAIDPRVNERE